MDVIAVGFQKGHGTAAAVIRTLCRGNYVHCEIVIDGRCFTTFMNSPWNRVSELPHDPRHEARGDWTYLYLRVGTHAKQQALRHCVRAKDTPYDYYGAVCSPIPVFRKIVSWFVDTDARVFCSELVTAALLAAGVPLDLNPQETDPCRLYRALVALPLCATHPINASSLLHL